MTKEETVDSISKIIASEYKKHANHVWREEAAKKIYAKHFNDLIESSIGYLMGFYDAESLFKKEIKELKTKLKQYERLHRKK